MNYKVKGLKIVKRGKVRCHCGTRLEHVTYQAKSGIEFSVAKDDFGVQICKSGHFFPDGNDFGTMKKAIAYLREHTQEAVDFFTNPANNELSLGELLMKLSEIFTEADHGCSDLR